MLKTFWLPWLLLGMLFVVGTFQANQYLYHNHVDKQKQLAQSSMRLASFTAQTQVQGLLYDIQQLAQHPDVLDFVRVPSRPQEALVRMVQSWALAHSAYRQIRLIHPDGSELFRVNHDGSGQIEKVAPTQLQDKKDRYYVMEGKKLKPGKVYLSPMDLNIEHKLVVQPYEPMIRLVKGVFSETGDLLALVVLNYDAEVLLRSLSQIPAKHLWLLNEEGYWLLGDRPEDAWGFMFNHFDRRVGFRYPDAWQKIKRYEAGEYENEKGIWLFQKLYPLRKNVLGVADKREHGAVVISPDYSWILVDFYSRSEIERAITEPLLWLNGAMLAFFGLFSGLLYRFARLKRISSSPLTKGGLHRLFQENEGLKQEVLRLQNDSDFWQKQLFHLAECHQFGVMVFHKNKLDYSNRLADEWLNLNSQSVSKTRCTLIEALEACEDKQRLEELSRYLKTQPYTMTRFKLPFDEEKDFEACFCGEPDSYCFVFSPVK